jgi:thiamine transporter
LITGVAYGLLQFVLDPYFLTLPQFLCDYVLAFGALGLAGFFHRKKWGLQIGYIVGVIGRYIFAVISGVCFFAEYAPEGTPALVYSLTYNLTYILPEAVATLIIISIPAVAKALNYVKRKAVPAGA